MSPLCASHSMPGAATGLSPTLWTWMQQLCGLPMPGRVHGRGSLRGAKQAVLWKKRLCGARVCRRLLDGAQLCGLAMPRHRRSKPMPCSGSICSSRVCSCCDWCRSCARLCAGPHMRQGQIARCRQDLQANKKRCHAVESWFLCSIRGFPI